MKSEMLGLLLRRSGVAESEEFVRNQLERPGDYLKLGKVPRPIPGAGQILIRMRRAAVNPSDIAFVQGFYGQLGAGPEQENDSAGAAQGAG